MIIAIDGYEANSVNRVGIGRYAYEILTNMYRLLSKNRGGTTVRVYIPSPPRPDMPKETSWWHYCVRKPSKLWTFLALPLALRGDLPAADVVFSPTHYVPRFVKIPRVMSIMDLSFLFFPEMFKRSDLVKLVHWTRHAARVSRRILTISQFSKNAIIRAYAVPENKVVVTYPGFSMTKSNGDQAGNPDLSKKYGVSKHFILSVGTIQPRKNYVRLIAAFAKFLKLNRQKFGRVELVIVGRKGWLTEPILEAPHRHGVEANVRFLTNVSDGDLMHFYRQALCFALPSLYEGFGLPVLEAMAYGCPVVISDTSSLPEIAGKAGVYVNPQDIDSIAGGLLAAVRERNLMQGRARVKAGLAQVKKFSWEKAARQTLAVLKDVAGDKS